MQRTIQRLANDIRALEYKISLLDKIAFASDQECKRTQQQIQELIAQKYITEKLIANISNGEDYSKVRQIVKENVKVMLSDNKKLISISFVALIQTIKTDPQMVNLILNIPSANDGEHKDNNNIIKYLELNKDSLSDLAEKNYENVVKALTNNTIDTAAAPSSSTSTLQLPSHSSLTFSSPFDQSDTYRREKSESFHNNKGDIDD